MDATTFARLRALFVAVSLLAAPSTGQIDPLAGTLDQRTRGCEADHVWEGMAVNDHLGHSLSVGDWNGDGKDDFISGNLIRKSPVETKGLTRGKAWLYLGGDTTGLPHMTFTDIAVVGDFAPTVSFIGDVDGDGGNDIAIGAMGQAHDTLGPNSGCVWIFLSDTDLSAQPSTRSTSVADLTISPPVAEWSANEQPHFGFSIAAVGDVNGDDLGDLLIGAPGPLSAARPDQDEADVDFVPQVHGRALVYFGTHPTTWPTTAGFDLGAVLDGGDAPGSGATAGDRFGWSVALAGDLDSDTHPDVAVGAVEAAHAGGLNFKTHGTGFALVYFGDGTGLSTALRIDPVKGVGGAGAEPKMFGHAISGGVDLDSAGSVDLLVASPLYSVAGNDQGAVYAYSYTPARARADTFAKIQPIYPPDVIVPPGNDSYLDESGRFGWSLAAMGDYDKDALPATRSEILVGALKASNPVDNTPAVCSGSPQGGRLSGRVYVLSIAPGASAPTVAALYRGEQGEGGGRMRLGTTVGVGDFNGDGYVDAILGGSGYATATVSEAGRVYIFENARAP